MQKTEKIGTLFNTTLFHEKLIKYQTSDLQRKYLTDSTYDLITPEGRNFRRTFELLGYNSLSGNVLVKEKVAFNGEQKYEKIYILSSEGKTEKYRGNTK